MKSRTTVAGAIATALSSALPPAFAGESGRVELTPTIGYLYGGSLDTEEGDVSIDEGPTAGGTVAVRARSNAVGLLRYTRQDTRFRLRDDGETVLEFDVQANYVQIGGAIEFRPRPVQPYAGLTLGAVGWVPEEDASSEWRFAGDLFAGLKWMPLRNVGLQFQADLLMTLVDADAAIFCGLPGGCLVLASGDPVFQGHVSGGVVVSF